MWPVDPRFRKLPRGTSISTPPSGGSGDAWGVRGWLSLAFYTTTAYPTAPNDVPPSAEALRGNPLRAGPGEILVVAAAEVDELRRAAGRRPQLDDARRERRYELAVVGDEDQGPR